MRGRVKSGNMILMTSEGDESTKEASQLFKVQSKLRAFVDAFRPEPPSVRPEGEVFRIGWDRLDALLQST
jgi:hypothetical protein